MSEHLLIVDDDEFICEINQEILLGQGYEVATAEDAEQAWKRLDQKPEQFDLVLLDKHLPGMDGIELLRKLKADPRFKTLPVVMLTGDSAQADIEEGLNEGAYYYLTKPSPEAVLMQVVRNALDDLKHKRELYSQVGKRTLGLHHLMRAEFSIRTIEEAKNLAIVLADASRQPARTVNGYSELLINAIEHGNLAISYKDKSELLKKGEWANEVERRLQQPQYAERQVVVQLSRLANLFSVVIIDQGAGFPWRDFLEFDPARAFDLHGRGIAMSKNLSFDDLRYLGNGNTVITTVYDAEAN